MSLVEQMTQSIDKIGASVEDFKKTEKTRIDTALDRIEELESKRSGPRPAANDGVTTGIEYFHDIKTAKKIPVFTHKDLYAATSPNKSGITVGRWLRGVFTGKHADDGKELGEEIKALATSPDASGGYTVPTALSAEFIDLFRAQLVLSQVGARFIPMDTKTLAFAKLLTDATTEWHAENSTVNASDPTFGAVDLTAKTIVGLVKFSVELAEDSINVENMLTRSLTSAVALAVDSAGLGNTISNGPSGIMSFGNRNRVRNIGALSSYDPWIDGMTSLFNANVPQNQIGSIVTGPNVWGALAKLKTGLSGDKSPLPKPSALANTPFVVSKGVALNVGSPTSEVSYMGNWSDLFYGVRTDIQLRILREAFIGSNLQIAALVYMRVDFAAAREQSFVTLEDFV